MTAYCGIRNAKSRGKLRPSQCGRLANHAIMAAMNLDWIVNGLKKPGKTQRGIAKALGRDPAAVTRLLAGERQLKAAEIAKIASYLGEAPPNLTLEEAEALLVEVYRDLETRPADRRLLLDMAMRLRGAAAQPPEE
jgi:transcriptional regulator with XRE-family HTH domain